MAKNMALIENSIVVNILWCSDSEMETEVLINPSDRPIDIGDTFINGKFYRDGEEILTPLEEALKTADEYAIENAELLDAMAEMIDNVYNQDLGLMEET